jgi:hypothetical protein
LELERWKLHWIPVRWLKTKMISVRQEFPQITIQIFQLRSSQMAFKPGDQTIRIQTYSSKLFTSSLSGNPTNGKTHGAALGIVDEAFVSLRFSPRQAVMDNYWNDSLQRQAFPVAQSHGSRSSILTSNKGPTLSISSLSDWMWNQFSIWIILGDISTTGKT